MICLPVIPVRTDVAARALGLVGTPFRLHGRNPAAGLDCVGLVAEALGLAAVPCEYTLRGDHLGRVVAFFDAGDFHSINDGVLDPGDILLLHPAVRQLHFAIVTEQGAVHAHAGLLRVVLSPLPLPWPIIGHWRRVFD